MYLLMKLKNDLRVLKVYSWVNVVLLAWIAVTLANYFEPFSVLESVLLALLLWCLFNIVSETIQKKEQREKPTSASFIVAFFVSIYISLRNFYSIVLELLILVSSVFYAQKNKNFFGYASIFFRGIIQATIFLSVFFFAGGIFNYNALIFSTVVFLLFTAINLIGDLRNIKFDKLTLAVKTGEFIAKVLSAILLMLAGLVSSLAFSSIALIPIALLVALVLAKFDSFKLHRISVFLTSIYFMIILYFLNQSIVLISIALILDLFFNILFYKNIS